MDDSGSGPIRLPIDQSVRRQEGESFVHWAGKAAVVEYLNTHDRVAGSVAVERKVEDLIADVRCTLSETPAEFPERFVVEVQTKHSKKDFLQTTRRYHRYGFAVFWIFHTDAYQQRRTAEETLADHMEVRPSLGLLSLVDGELQFGHPLEPGDLATQRPTMTCNEMYIPTYHRHRHAYDHGDFTITNDEELAIITIGDTVHISHTIDEEGQRTLPRPLEDDPTDIASAFQSNSISRTSPVRGPP